MAKVSERVRSGIPQGKSGYRPAAHRLADDVGLVDVQMVEQAAQIFHCRIRIARQALRVGGPAPATLVPGDDAVGFGEYRSLVHPNGVVAAGAVAQHDDVSAAGTLVVDALAAEDNEARIGLTDIGDGCEREEYGGSYARHARREHTSVDHGCFFLCRSIMLPKDESRAGAEHFDAAIGVFLCKFHQAVEHATRDERPQPRTHFDIRPWLAVAVLHDNRVLGIDQHDVVDVGGEQDAPIGALPLRLHVRGDERRVIDFNLQLLGWVDKVVFAVVQAENGGEQLGDRETLDARALVMPVAVGGNADIYFTDVIRMPAINGRQVSILGGIEQSLERAWRDQRTSPEVSRR